MRRIEDRIELPTAAELPMVERMAREAFAEVGVELKALEAPAGGGFKAKAAMTAADRERLVCALFAHGIVMVDLGPEEFGFAVRR